MREIEVSIICNTYNHEKYIKEALDSFLMQKTNFKYEVLIHDDASTDKTADIIRIYEKKYPNIIKPIYQQENQYSQNIDIGFKYQIPRVRGKYIALCEGDDYWTDPLKLQKQFDYMEKHTELDICSHATTRIKASSGEKIGLISPSDKFVIFDVRSVINGGGGFVGTNTLFYRSNINKNIPQFRKYYSLDYTLQIHGSMRGGMLYLPDKMSVYRSFVPGSWSDRMNKPELVEYHYLKMQKMLNLLNLETNYQYSNIIKDKISEAKFYALEKAGKYTEIRNSDLQTWYAKQSLQWKMMFYIKKYFPSLVQIYRKIKWQ